jgi:hypothetical protein
MDKLNIYTSSKAKKLWKFSPEGHPISNNSTVTFLLGLSLDSDYSASNNRVIAE